MDDDDDDKEEEEESLCVNRCTVKVVVFALIHKVIEL